MSGWQLSGDAPSLYIRFATTFMEPWTDDLIRQAKCKDGDRVLDLACGTGFVATRVNEVSSATCQIIGLDVNEGMLNAARRDTSIDWRLGSALEIPFPDESFDVVLCQQGLQYFPDRQLAVKEIARVLAPGGRVSLNVWGAMERHAFVIPFVDALGLFLGAEAKSAFDLAYSLNTREELQSLAAGAGLRNAEVRFEHRTIRAPDVAAFAMGFVQASPVAAKYMALADDEKEKFGAYVANKLTGYVDDAGMAAPQENHFLFAVR